MTEGGPARVSNTIASAGGSFLGWVSGGSMRPPEPRGVRRGSKFGDADEDVRSWVGFERRRYGVSQPKEPLAMKGPAFWSKAATTPQQRAHAHSFRGSWLRMPNANRCVCPELRKAVYVLVVFALTLFFVMSCLITAYISNARNMDSFTLHLGGQQRRLTEAVRNLARGQRLRCVPCQKYWMQTADACYLFTTEKMSWQECVGHCKAKKSSLLIGVTEGEMVSVMLETRRRFTARNKRLSPGRYWIGLMYNKTAQTWLWADGAPLHIRMSGTEKKPSFYEDICVLFHNGHLDSKQCTIKNQCLCKRKAP